ncbi:MAG: aldo/keto reductase [Candidatus Sericytochromatia bacterium]
MHYRLLGRTGLYVSEICLGTMTYGGKGFWEAIGQLGQEEVNSHVKTAFEAGVNFFDTANIYSFGESETLFGEALRATGLPREELVIATKVRGRMGPGPNQVGLSRKHIFSQLENSLRRLGCDYVDLYQIHGFDPVTPLDEILHALDDLVSSGKVRYLGVSNHAAWQIMKALGLSQQHHWNRFESIQAYYSIAGRDLEREIVPLALDQQLGILVWSPLAGGLLSGKFSREGEGPEDARRAKFDFPPVDRQRAFDCVDAMRAIAEGHQVSVAQVALAWVLRQPAISSVIIGAKTLEQLKQNLATSELRLKEDELRALNEVSQLPPEYPGWMVARQGSDRSPPNQ